MKIGTFLLYYLLFFVIITVPALNKQITKNKLFKVLLLPLVFATILAFLAVVRIYFIYKLLILVIFLILIAIAYWKLRKRIHNRHPAKME